MSDEFTDASAFAEEAGAVLGAAYADASGVTVTPAIIAILIQIVTTLLASCPKPPTASELKSAGQSPGLLVNVMLNRQIRKAVRRSPEPFDPVAAKVAILKTWAAADEPKCAQALALAKMVG